MANFLENKITLKSTLHFKLSILPLCFLQIGDQIFCSEYKPGAFYLTKSVPLFRKDEGLIDCLNWASIVRHNPRSLKVDKFRVKTSWCLPKDKPEKCKEDKFKFLMVAFKKYGWDEAFCHVKHVGVGALGKVHTCA